MRENRQIERPFSLTRSSVLTADRFGTIAVMTDHPRIGFDALFFEQPMTGSGRYALNLWRQLRRRFGPDRLALLAPGDAGELVQTEGDGYLASVAGPPLRGRPRKLWWEQTGLPRAVRSSDPVVDLVHIPYFAAPAIKTVPYVVTIHDLIPIVVPEYHGSFAMRSYLQLVARTSRGAALILTDSEYSRQEIVRVLGLELSRVRSIPLAADEQFSPASSDEDIREIEEVKQRFGIERPYILNTGGLDIRKNVATIIEGFALAQGALDEDYDLVIVGRAHTGNARMYPPLDRLIRRSGLVDRIRLVGAVDEDEFVALYRGAEFFVFASTYEGFGLTPLEAMACGTPVVSSGRTSLAEVVGDAGLIIEPTPRAVASGIMTLANDPGLRAELGARGLERSQSYTWQATADHTLEAYRDALGTARA